MVIGVQALESSSQSWNVSNNHRPDQVCEPYREPLPDSDGKFVFVIARIDLRQGSRLPEPVVPAQLNGLCAPLLLEVIGPSITRRAAEIESSISLLTGELEAGPIEKHVGARASESAK